MSKIVYPESDTLSSLVRNPINDTLQALNTAQNYCVYTIPNDFAYLGYLKDLGNKILEFRQELTNISRTVEGIDKSYSSTLDGLDAYKETLNLSVLEERSRLIK